MFVERMQEAAGPARIVGRNFPGSRNNSHKGPVNRQVWCVWKSMQTAWLEQRRDRRWFTILPPEEVRVENDNCLSCSEGRLPAWPGPGDGSVLRAGRAVRPSQRGGHYAICAEEPSAFSARVPQNHSPCSRFPSSSPSLSKDPAFSESKSFLQGHSPYKSSYIFNKLYSKEVTFRSSIFPSNWKIRLHFYYIKLIIPSE